MVHDDYNDRVEEYQGGQDEKRELIAQKLKGERAREFERLILESRQTYREISRLRKVQKKTVYGSQEKDEWRDDMIRILRGVPKDMLFAYFKSECRFLATKIINDDNLLAVASVEVPGSLASLQLYYPHSKKTLNDIAFRAKTYRAPLDLLMDKESKEERTNAAIHLELAIDFLMICIEAQNQ